MTHEKVEKAESPMLAHPLSNERSALLVHTALKLRRGEILLSLGRETSEDHMLDAIATAKKRARLWLLDELIEEWFGRDRFISSVEDERNEGESKDVL